MYITYIYQIYNHWYVVQYMYTAYNTYQYIKAVKQYVLPEESYYDRDWVLVDQDI